MKVSVKVLVLVACVFVTIPTWAQPVNLNCAKEGGYRARVVFDEQAGTALFTGDTGEGEASPATFTEREITWDADMSGLAHPYYILNRMTGELRIVHRRKNGPDAEEHSWQCTVGEPAKPKF
jgi:hypothetical protein